jgi:predicted RNase H-like HicB family nuclease
LVTYSHLHKFSNIFVKFVFAEYIKAAMRHAHYEYWEDDKLFFGKIPLLDGVLTTGVTLEECRDELEEILEGWLLLSLRKNLVIPVIDNIPLDIKEVA